MLSLLGYVVLEGRLTKEVVLPESRCYNLACFVMTEENDEQFRGSRCPGPTEYKSRVLPLVLLVEISKCKQVGSSALNCFKGSSRDAS
jgi:hypothetical protein